MPVVLATLAGIMVSACGVTATGPVAASPISTPGQGAATFGETPSASAPIPSVVPGTGRAKPTPTPTSTTYGPWSQLDCRWAEQTMRQDETLDGQAAVHDEQQGDTSLAQTYFDISQRWATILAQIEGVCQASPVYPSGAAQAQAVAWLAEGYDSHAEDLAGSPQNPGWDRLWEANYQRLADLYFLLPCSDAGGAAPAPPSDNCAWQSNRQGWPSGMDPTGV